MEGHPDGRAAGDGGVIGPDHVGVSGAEGAGRLRGDDVLRVLQADPEEDVAVAVSPADALRSVEGVDLQLEHTRGQHLRRQEGWSHAPHSHTHIQDDGRVLDTQKPTYCVH